MKNQIIANKRNTILIIFGFVIFITLLGGLFSYLYKDISIVIWVCLFSIGYAVIQYFLAGKISVAMTGAKEIRKTDNPRFYSLVEELSKEMKLPMPRVYIIKDPAPNAFATGRDPEHAIVASTTGLLEIMDNKELKAVIAHELSHVKNYDIRVSMIVFGLVCVIGALSDLGFRLLFFGRNRRTNDKEQSPIGLIIVLASAILAPIAASISQMAVSREREYLADASAAKVLQGPDDMISALKKLDSHGRPMQSQNTAAESMYISNPLKKGFLTNLFSTHPPIEKRIARLNDAKK